MVEIQKSLEQIQKLSAPIKNMETIDNMPINHTIIEDYVFLLTGCYLCEEEDEPTTPKSQSGGVRRVKVMKQILHGFKENHRILVFYFIITLCKKRCLDPVFPDDVYYYKYFDKLGFKKEAVLKEEIYVDGEYVDVHKFALFKREWLSQKK